MMDFNASVRHSGGVAIVDLSGRIVFGPETEALRNALQEVFQKGDRYILLNLERIDYMDSGGVGELVSSYSSITRRGGVVRLLRPSERVRGLLRVTTLDRLFDIQENEQQAVSGFGPAIAARNLARLKDFSE
jgi:anti-anti-sigma factor